MNRLKERSDCVGPRESYISALRCVCLTLASGDLWAISFDLLVGEVIVELRDASIPDLSAYEALVDVSRASSTKRRSAAAIAETVRGSFETLLPLFLNRMLEFHSLAVEIAMLADFDVEVMAVKRFQDVC